MAYSLLPSDRCLHPLLSTEVTPTLPGRPRAPHARARARALVTVVLAAVVVTAGCFSHPINRAPVVLSIDQVGNVVRGQEASFTARTSDPDSDAVEVSWAVEDGDCPPALGDPATWSAGIRASTFQVPRTFTSGSFCVWAFATDPYGAMGAATRTVAPADQPPVAEISLDSPDLQVKYPLYTRFRLSGKASIDPDGDPVTTYEWSLRSPSGSSAHLDACDDAADPSVRCFDADRPGLHVASLIVTSGGSPSVPAGLDLDVLDDTPPCIRLTAPDYETSFLSRDPDDEDDQNRTFTVKRVDDDGDPYPNPTGLTQNLTFTWFLTEPDAPPGTPLAVQDLTFSSLTIPRQTYRSGDETTVRVEVHDRRIQAVDDILRSCAPGAPLCGKTPDCHQWVSWTVRWQ